MKKTKITAAALIAVTCSSFAIQGREEELRFTPVIRMEVSADCFGNFLRNLKKINAIIYIPDSKIQKGMGMNLTRVQRGSNTLNMGNYMRVVPVTKRGDECSSSVKVDFDNLNMVVYVEKSRIAEMPDLNLHKLEGKFDVLFPKLEQSGQNIGQPKLADKVMIKWEGKFSEFSQVEFKF